MTDFFPPFDFSKHVLLVWSGEQFRDTAWTVAMGCLVALACGWLGCWLILQGLALIGDAISHTVLLGIVVACLATGSVTGVAVVVAATLTGVITVLLIDTLHGSTRIKQDAAIGIVFTALFALGVALQQALLPRAHIDTRHVLYGDLEFISLGHATAIAGWEVPQPVLQMALIVCLLLGLLLAFYKQLLLVAFDAQLAASLGIRPVLYRYGMLGALSLTAVGAFRAVGSILVVALLIAPAATAYLLTNRLPAMLALSSLAGVLSSLAGYHVSVWLDVSAAGAMTCVACGLFALAFLFSPSQGVVSAVVRRARRRLVAREENILRRVWKLTEGREQVAVPASEVARDLTIGRIGQAWSVAALTWRGWAVRTAPAHIRLTHRGAVRARQLDRAHRLWETYLVDTIGLPTDHVHPSAEEVEHVLSTQLVDRLEDALGHPDTDPHGAPIPRHPVSDDTPDLYSLSTLHVGDTGRIAGLTGEEALVSHRLEAPDSNALVARLGLALGQPVKIVARDPEGKSWTVSLDANRTLEVPHDLADAIVVRLETSALDTTRQSQANGLPQ